MPQNTPHNMLAIHFIRSGLMPAVRSVSGCSPAARIQKPYGVL